MGTTTRLATSLRIHPDDLQRIDQLAAEYRLNRTAYLIKAALGQLNEPDIDQRLADLEHRLERLEQLAHLAA